MFVWEIVPLTCWSYTNIKTKTNATHLKGRNGAKNEGEGGDDDKSDGDDGDNLTKDFKSAQKIFFHFVDKNVNLVVWSCVL